MRVVESGHVYDVNNVDGPGYQRIVFVRRRGDKAELLPERPPHDHSMGGFRTAGILSQELIRVLIDRTLYLLAEAPCDEDVEIVQILRRCLRLYESRAARRTIEKLPMPEMIDVCARCHHILCRCDEPSRLEHGIER